MESDLRGTALDPLDEQGADLLVAENLEKHTTDGIENAPFSTSENLDDATPVNSRRQMNIVRHADYKAQPYSASRNLSLLEDHIRHALPFKGRYGTVINDRRLMIPADFMPLLEFGGTITYGNDEQLLLFGRQHWSRMEQLLIKDLGLKANHDSLVRHFYRAKMDFDKLNDDGSVTLSRALMQFAGLKDKAVMIGVVYFAEIHNPEKYNESRLDGRDIAKLSNALS